MDYPLARGLGMEEKQIEGTRMEKKLLVRQKEQRKKSRIVMEPRQNGCNRSGRREIFPRARHNFENSKIRCQKVKKQGKRQKENTIKLRTTYPINDQQLSANVLACVACQKYDGTHKVGWFAPSASRYAF